MKHTFLGCTCPFDNVGIVGIDEEKLLFEYSPTSDFCVDLDVEDCRIGGRILGCEPEIRGLDDASVSVSKLSD